MVSCFDLTRYFFSSSLIIRILPFKMNKQGIKIRVRICSMHISMPGPYQLNYAPKIGKKIFIQPKLILIGNATSLANTYM